MFHFIEVLVHYSKKKRNGMLFSIDIPNKTLQRISRNTSNPVQETIDKYVSFQQNFKDFNYTH